MFQFTDNSYAYKIADIKKSLVPIFYGNPVNDENEATYFSLIYETIMNVFEPL